MAINPKDLVGVVKFYENCGHSPIYRMAIDAMAELNNLGYGNTIPYPPAWNDPALVMFDECERTVRGFMIYRYDQEQASWWIILAYTHPKHRKQGVHTALFESLVERAEQRGDILAIESGTHVDNKPAQKAFEKQRRFAHYIGYRYEIRPAIEGKHHLEIKDKT